MVTYSELKTIAGKVRDNIEAAQKSGALDPKWQIITLYELTSTRDKPPVYRAEVAVYIQGDAVTDEFLVCPIGEADDEIKFTDEALALARQVRGLMAPANEWQDGQRFASLYWRDGLPAGL